MEFVTYCGNQANLPRSGRHILALHSHTHVKKLANSKDRMKSNDHTDERPQGLWADCREVGELSILTKNSIEHLPMSQVHALHDLVMLGHVERALLIYLHRLLETHHDLTYVFKITGLWNSKNMKVHDVFDMLLSLRCWCASRGDFRSDISLRQFSK